jgi:hypothetical protein
VYKLYNDPGVNIIKTGRPRCAGYRATMNGAEAAQILTSSNRKGDVAKGDRRSGESQYLSAEGVGERELNRRPRPEWDYRDKKNTRNRVKVKVKLVPFLN